MGHTICICSLKGGVGKTTTAVNLSASLGVMGRKTLLVDCDPQGSSTVGIGLNKNALSKTLYNALMGTCVASEILQQSDIESVEVIPSDGELYHAEMELLSDPKKERALSIFLSEFYRAYDYIIIDTPPSIGLLSINAIGASDYVLIPLQCEFMAYESLIHLLKFLRSIKKKLNPNLRTIRILLTMFDMGQQISVEIANNVRKRLRHLVFETVIPRSVHVQEASSHRRPILLQDEKSIGAISYLKLAQEIIEQEL